MGVTRQHNEKIQIGIALQRTCVEMQIAADVRQMTTSVMLLKTTAVNAWWTRQWTRQRDDRAGAVSCRRYASSCRVLMTEWGTSFVVG